MRIYIKENNALKPIKSFTKQNNTLKSVRPFSKNELIPPEPPFVPTPELVYTLSADGTYYIVGTGFTSIEAINVDSSGGNAGSGLNSSWSGGEVNIPAMYNGKPVKAIAPRTFNNVVNITRVYIQDGEMTTIGHRCLQCDSTVGNTDGGTLLAVHLPNTLTELGGPEGRVFWGRKGLTNVRIPDLITVLRNSTFAYTGSGLNVDLNNIIVIGTDTFQHSRLTSITIPNSVTNIQPYAFRNCSGLTSITIPSSVTSLGQGAFANASNLATFNFDGTISQWNAVSKIAWKDGLLITIVHCTDGDVPV